MDYVGTPIQAAPGQHGSSRKNKNEKGEESSALAVPYRTTGLKRWDGTVGRVRWHLGASVRFGHSRRALLEIRRCTGMMPGEVPRQSMASPFARSNR